MISLVKKCDRVVQKDRHKLPQKFDCDLITDGIRRHVEVIRQRSVDGKQQVLTWLGEPKNG